jgi:hypothetical protein
MSPNRWCMRRFPEDYSKEELSKLVLHHRDLHVEATTELYKLKEKFIVVSKELSALKRAKKQ